MIALVTGSSRGVGAETARLLAARGAHVYLNYRDKLRRAEAVREEITSAGGQATLVQADLTVPADVAGLAERIRAAHGRLDLLVLNASGGLERDVAPDYALRLNRDAQLAVLDAALPLLGPGTRVVYNTSHQAHFHHTNPIHDDYTPVAASKRAGEDALRARLAELTARDITLVVVSGDMIEGTITPTLLERITPGTIEARRAKAGQLPTVAEFAAEVVTAATAPLPTGHTVYVGGEDLVAAGQAG
ncbi:NAD(P)-dependent dehydrogenase (short-subunit alcohol dehydrogenase family) [Crossiella equi]|uniref:NAD(P)-dependent dehydrogenase (Short-subunit alcohol dehydrogenase family) n=1 Tax=Crossiella equi TaxID=130796 RepID=A0ABS5AS85_9PSEU|nr:SDR family oxidoreductase [Crossiella equi]MBP2479426.1 NAD(P)-dependent dehydrogenase (short-subunit alcohol dehydrogenase family) [Crossiella equi]